MTKTTIAKTTTTLNYVSKYPPSKKDKPTLEKYRYGFQSISDLDTISIKHLIPFTRISLSK